MREIVLTQGCDRYGHFTGGAPGVLVSDGYYETAGDRRAVCFGETFGGDSISHVDTDWAKGSPSEPPPRRLDAPADVVRRAAKNCAAIGDLGA